MEEDGCWSKYKDRSFNPYTAYVSRVSFSQGIEIQLIAEADEINGRLRSYLLGDDERERRHTELTSRARQMREI